jgi:hypothetical protein
LQKKDKKVSIFGIFFSLSGTDVEPAFQAPKSLKTEPLVFNRR